MREPTQGMLEDRESPLHAERIWRAMIDEALK